MTLQTVGHGSTAQQPTFTRAVGAPDVGSWSYAAGVDGAVNITGQLRVLQITATALQGQGTITINGGDAILLPYGEADSVSSSITIEPKGNLVDPVIQFTNTSAYFSEMVAGDGL